MYKIIFICLISVYFLFEIFINILSYRSRNNPIPEELSDIYDEATYLRWKEYSAEKIKIDIISKSFGFLLTLLLVIFDVFALISRGIENVYLSAFAVLGLYIGSSTIFDIIFNYINDIKIEGKYGFNKSSMKTFIGDQIKSLLLSIILIGGLTSLFIALYTSMHDYILILFTAIVFIFVLFINFLFPYLSRINNKFTSLEEGELRISLTNMLEKYGYHVRDIKVMDASRRTTKSNAYFAGLGKSKTIVLYDNLLNVMTNEEIIAIFAHEMGHGLHKDIVRNTIMSLLNISIMVVSAWLLVRFPIIYQDFGFNDVNYGFAVILLFGVIPFVLTLLSFFTSYMSRRAEYAADKQAYIEGYGDELITGLKKISKENFANLNPHPLIVKLKYSHPTLLQRVRAINKLKEEK